jgi:hypothetical protein
MMTATTKKKNKAIIKANKNLQSSNARNTVRVLKKDQSNGIDGFLRNRMASIVGRGKENDKRTLAAEQDRLELKAAVALQNEKKSRLLDLQIEQAEEEKEERARKRMRESAGTGSIN